VRSANILMFLVFLNGAAALMGAAGVTDAMGVQPEVGGDETINQAQENSQNVSAGADAVQTTFIGNVVEAAKTAGKVFSVVYAGPQMISNLGVPTWLTAFIFGPMYFVVALDVLSVFTQFRVQS